MSSPERPGAPPRVVFRPGRLARIASDGAALAMLGVVLLATPSMTSHWLPWPSVADLAGEDGALVYALCVVGGLVALNRWGSARAGQAELFADRLVVVAGHEAQTYYLADLEAFDDSRGDVVRLRPRSRGGAAPARDLFVPTLVERPRAVLLDALTGAGVPRVEGAGLPRASLPHDRLRLTLRGRGSRYESVGCLSLLLAMLLVLVVPALADSSASVGWLASAAAALAAMATGATGVVSLGLATNRRGQAWLFNERIELDPLGSSGARRLVIAWDELVGWRDESPDYVRLVLRDGLLREAHGSPTLPTPTPELRARLEALLAEKQVPLVV